jgi:hypothetical protein
MIYSTYADQHLINACLQMGASVIRSKPVTKEGYDEMMDVFLNDIDLVPTATN